MENSKIQPWQKLCKGDFCKVNSIDQIEEIFRTEKAPMSETYIIKCLKSGVLFYNSDFNSINGNPIAEFQCETEYNFADFRQLCENTFQNH